MSCCPQPLASPGNKSGLSRCQITMETRKPLPALSDKKSRSSASTSREMNAAFATFVNERPDAVFVGGDPFFNDRRVQLANVASYHKVPEHIRTVTLPKPAD